FGHTGSTVDHSEEWTEKGISKSLKQKVPEVGIEPTRGCPHGILSPIPPCYTPQSNPITPEKFKHFASCDMELLGDIWEYVPHSFPHSSPGMRLCYTAKNPTTPA